MEIISRVVGNGLDRSVAGRRTDEMIQVPQSRRAQRTFHIVQDRRGPVAEAASNLLVKAEKHGMGRRINKTSCKDIANAARHHEIIVPFAFSQERIREVLGYFVADAYYAAGKMLNGLLKQGNHLVTRVKANAVAYAPAPRKEGRKTRGRPKTYGKKIKLKSLLANVESMQQVASPVYGEHNVTLRYRVCDLLWRPAGRLVRFVVVVHPTRGSCILMCTDTSLSAVDIIRLYGLRFKIECSFKQAVRQIGSFSYHFWMKEMIPLRYHNGNQYLHRKSPDYRNRVKRKMRAYHAFIQAGVVAQGLLQYLAVAAPKLVWSSFGSWLRTIRPDIPPSEFVVAKALRQTLPEFLMGPAKSDSLTKFIAERQDMQNMRIFRLAS